MIIELMMLLIAVGAGIVFVAWNNNRRRNHDVQDRREVVDSTGKLKQELERTANEIIGRMENHVAHLENVLDESERNRAQLEGRVNELKNLLRKSEGHSDEIRDLLARLDDAGTEINTMQRKMDVVERKINLAMTTPLPVQQAVTIPQMPQPLVTPMMTTPVTSLPKVPVTQVTTPPAPPINPLGPINIPQISRTPTTKAEPSKAEPPVKNEFDKILEESLAEGNAQEKSTRSSIVLSPENKQPMKVVEADPVKIEATRKKLTEASAKIADSPPEDLVGETQAKTLRKKRTKTSRARDVRKAALDAIREAEKISSRDEKKTSTEKILPERRENKLETTNSSVIKEMLISGMSIEEIARETGLGRGEIELVQEMTRRQLQRR